MNNNTIFIIQLIFLLILSAFFSASETSLTKLGKIQLKRLKKQNKQGAKRIETLLSSGNKFLSTILIGNNLVNITLSSLTTVITISLFGSNAIAISTAIITVLLIIFGEIIPKTLANKYSEKIACFSSRFILILQYILTPVIWLISKITNLLTKIILHNKGKKLPTITQEELETVISTSEKTGVLEHSETTMMNRIFEFSDQLTKDCMTPVKEICAIPSDIPYTKMLQLFQTKQFSRIPIYEGSIYNIVGIIHYKDVLYWQCNKEERTDLSLCGKNLLSKLKSEVLKVLPTTRLSEVRELMRQHNKNIAIVVSTTGKTVGLITMEDIIEEVFND